MDLRQPPFYSFLREERQFCAVLAHLLMQRGDNLKTFVELLNQRPAMGSPLPIDNLEEAEVYIEYAYLRDLWDGFGVRPNRTRPEANGLKRAFIQNAFADLGLCDGLPIDWSAPPQAFNDNFISGHKIKLDIASPHHWSVSRLHELAGNSPDFFRALCKFKWSFNIKPDLVIAVPGSWTLCIEAKLESREGFYPTGTSEIKIFDERFGARKGRIRQFELQAFMFRELLHVEAQQVVIARDISEGKQEAGKDANVTPVLIWTDVFSHMDLDGSLPFVRRLVNENSTIREHGPAPADV